MPQESPQSYKNHVRYDPTFHFFLIPLTALLLLAAIFHEVRFHSPDRMIIVGLALALFVGVFKARTYSLKVQDRVIRLEERIRLASVLPDSLRSRIPELTESQLIALRFASEPELPLLVERALREHLTGKQIKQSVQNWRPDYWRV